MFDYILQLSDAMIFRVFDEMRKAALPVLPQTVSVPVPIDLGGGLTITPVINLPDTIFPLSLNEQDQTVEIVINDAPIQLLAVGGVANGNVLYETDASFLIRLPLHTKITDDTVHVGTDPLQFDDGTVLATIEDGHPLADDAVLLELLNREFHTLLTSSGFPVTENIDNLPLTGTPYEVSAFIRFNESITHTDDLSARVEPSPMGGNFFRFVVPLEVWANLELPDSDEPVQNTHFLAELSADVPISRDLNPAGGAQAEVLIRFSSASSQMDVLEIIDGADITDDADIWGEIQDLVSTEVETILKDFGDQSIRMMSLDALTALLREVVRNVISIDRDDDGTADFIDFWSTDRSQEIDTVEAAILGDTLTIAINGDNNTDISDIDPFIPLDRDFAVKVSGDNLLEEISSLLVAPDEYDDAKGRLSLGALTQEGSTDLIVQGFDVESGTFRRNTRLRIDGFIYTVNADAEISRLEDDDPSPATGKNRNQAEVSISPDLRSDMSDGVRVRVEYGVGLPITEDVDFLSWRFRVEDDITPTLQDGHVLLSGRGKLLRKHLRDVGADVSMKIALDWVSTSSVRGAGQDGDDLAVATRSETLREYRDGSRIIVDDHREPYGLTATVNAGDTTLALTRELDSSPEDGGMISLRWIKFGKVVGSVQTGNSLQIGGLTEGEGLIPKGAILRVAGINFTIESDATIDDDGRATISLSKRLDEEIEDGPADNALVKFRGGWWARAQVDGADQTGSSIEVSGITRIVPKDQPISIAGINGVFSVLADANINDNEATVTLKHQAMEELSNALPGIDETDDLWQLLGQPQENASVGRRTGGQSTEMRRVGDVDVNLDSALDEVLGALIGLLGGLLMPGGLISRVLVAAIAGVISRNMLRKKLQEETNDFELDDVIDLPIDDQLKGLGVYLEPILNNPIEISPEGLLFAGQANPGSSYPEVDESRAKTFGPFDFAAGQSGQLSGSGPAPATLYAWRTGDGKVIAGTSANHTYPRRGTYIADYKGLDTQLIAERRTRELTKVDVRNTPPELGALPLLSGLEGEEITLKASFTDIAWTDAHRAIVDWGDGRLPKFAEISETLGPPITKGELIAKHRYCDNGDFVVTVILEDAQGGAATRQTKAKIANVPPKVDAGDDMFAHPCVPLRLVGHFTDPGWCDTHTGIWDFGDCSPLFAATIEETHEPPEGRGTATATHCYEGCGTWKATLTVIDDDGGMGTDSIIVTRSALLNGGFEDGFARHRLGNVGRHWQPYADAATSSLPPGPVFDCESCVVFDGNKAQAVTALAYRAAGIWQRFGANIGWEYQISARFSITGTKVTGWLGVDPNGGDDRNSAAIVWRSLSAKEAWQGVSTRVVAEKRAVTVFVEFRDPGAEKQIIDQVEMQAYSCVHEEPPEEAPCPKPKTVCVSWADYPRSGNLGTHIDFEDFQFNATSGVALTTVMFGHPAGAKKLLIPDSDGPDSLMVKLPAEAHSVTATVSGPPDQKIEMKALGLNGAVLASDSNQDGGIRQLTVSAAEIARIEIISERRGTLQKICADIVAGFGTSDTLTARPGQ